MKLRLTVLPDEASDAIEAIRRTFKVIGVSGPYANTRRRRGYDEDPHERIYIEAELKR